MKPRFLLAFAAALALIAAATPAQAVPAAALVPIAASIFGTASSLFVVAATAGAFLINTAIAYALTGVTNKLLAPKAARSNQERQAAVLSLSVGESPREAVFGRAVTGGTLLDAFNFGGTNKTDWEVLVIKVADHLCDGLEGFYIGDTYYAFSADGAQSGFNGQLEVYWKDGSPSQAASSYLTTNSPNRLYNTDRVWTSSDVAASMAYVVVAYKADAPNAANPVWPQGRPSFKFKVRGKRCYDPRKDSTVTGGSGSHRWATPSTWEWSENLRICDYNYDRGIYAKDQVSDATQLLIGRGLSELEAKPARVFAAANLCDEAVTLKAGGTEPRYRVGGVVFADEPFITIKERFAAAGAGEIVKRDGGVEVMLGAAQSTVLEITDADLVIGEEITDDAFLSDNDRVNTVIPRYVEPAQLWKDHAAPVRRSTSDITADGGQKTEDLSLAMVTSGTQAQRCGEIRRRMNRKERRETAVLPPPMSNLEDGDWIGWTSDAFFNGGRVVFRIDAVAVRENYRTALALREIASSCYAWTASSDESTPGAAPVDEAGSLAPLALAGVSISPWSLAGAFGVIIPGVKATWTTPVDAAITGVRMEVRKVGASEVAVSVTQDPNAGQLAMTEGVPSGVDVEVRLIPIGIPGRRTTATSWTTITAASLLVATGGAGGGNRLRYTLFERGADIGWETGTNPSGVAIDAATTPDLLGYAVRISTIHFTAAGQIVSVRSDDALEFPVQGGERISLQERVLTAGPCTAETVIWWFDNAGAAIGNSSVFTIAANTAYATLKAGFVTAPSNAVRGYMETYVTSAGTTWPTDGFFEFMQPMISGATASQTDHPAFVAGPDNEVGADITASHTAADVAQGQGANAIFDTGFRLPGTYWLDLFASSGTVTNTQGSEGGVRYFRRQFTGTPAAGAQLNLGQSSSTPALPVNAGDKIEASAYFAGTGIASAGVAVVWFDAAGSFLTVSSPPGFTGNPATADFTAGLASATRAGGIVTAPSGAKLAVFDSSTLFTATAGAKIAMACPHMRKATAGQTALSAWTPGFEAQLGADVTSQNTANDTTHVNGTLSTTITTGIAPLIDTVAPGAPTGLTATSALQTNFLSWMNPSDTDLQKVEVWEHTADVRASATLIATVAAKGGVAGAFARAGLATGASRYYWVRGVDLAGNVGAFNGTAGTLVTTATLTVADFPSNLRAPGRGSSLPTASTYDGDTFYLTTDQKLYRKNAANTGWIVSVATSDLSGQVGSGQIASGAVGTTELAVGAVTTNRITAGAITTALIAAGAITATELAAGSVTAGKIAAASIAADRMNVATLSAIAANIGTVTAGLLQDSTGDTFFDLTNARQQFKVGSYVRRTGALGSGVVDWFGLASVAIGSETRTNGVWAFGTDGLLYTGAVTLDSRFAGSASVFQVDPDDPFYSEPFTTTGVKISAYTYLTPAHNTGAVSYSVFTPNPITGFNGLTVYDSAVVTNLGVPYCLKIRFTGNVQSSINASSQFTITATDAGTGQTVPIPLEPLLYYNP